MAIERSGGSWVRSPGRLWTHSKRGLGDKPPLARRRRKIFEKGRGNYIKNCFFTISLVDTYFFTYAILTQPQHQLVLNN
jgi:hypothetical protein